MRNLLKRFRSDQRGSIAIMAAGGMVLAVCCAALGVDIGTISADRRKTQSTADISAIVAASNISNATNAAKAVVTKNKYPESALISVELGTYTANAALPPAARFVTPAVGVANAARVKLQTQTPLYFSHFFTGQNNFVIKTEAIAKTSSMASFAIGSRLASVNNGFLNSLLGSMLGTTLSLSVMDYNALLGAKIDALTFLNALATRVNLTGVTYDTLLNTNIKVGDVIAAALSTQQAMNGGGTATTALQSVVTATSGLTSKILPKALFDLGPYSSGAVGGTQVGIGLSLFDLLKATAGVANGNSQVSTDVNLGIPGLLTSSVKIAIGAQPTGTSWITVGSQGVSVHTAQTRVLSTINLLGSGNASVVALKTYVEVGSGTATLNNITCGYPDISTSTVTLGVTPGIVDAWIGDVSNADFNNFATKPNPPAATIVNVLGIVTVSARAHVEIGNTTPVPVTFNYTDIQAQTKKTVNTTNFTSSLTSSLLNDLVLNVNILGLGIGLGTLGQLVTSIISGATAGIDQLLSTVLGGLGVGIGQADVWVTGIRCNGAVLVN